MVRKLGEEAPAQVSSSSLEHGSKLRECSSFGRFWWPQQPGYDQEIVTRALRLLDIMIVQFRNEKVSNHGSLPITIDCNVVAFIVFEEGFHQPIKRTKQDVTVFRHTLVD
ncbi:hypothetical protein TNCV_1993641 [Trichonephila clavipes]|nr:hypothetical protein TNCV_1993641 [Trichonephila clavipes]